MLVSFFLLFMLAKATAVIPPSNTTPNSIFFIAEILELKVTAFPEQGKEDLMSGIELGPNSYLG
jgi:hypothetical protein